MNPGKMTLIVKETTAITEKPGIVCQDNKRYSEVKTPTKVQIYLENLHLKEDCLNK